MEKRDPSAPSLRMQSGQSLWKTIWSILKKLNMKLPFDPVIPLLRRYPKDPETPIPRSIRSLMFIAEVFTIAKIGE